ncbi:MAG: hypothetical protein KJZ59_08085 [Pararhodobacter sp.]|nr:hypothetical protein [Pararhodobacter sp.]
MDRRQVQTLTRLQAMGALKKDAELARLATVAASRSRLQAALDALKRTEAPLDPTGDGPTIDPAMLGARLAHRRWIEAQQRRLNQQLALVTADFLRQKPAAARAFGRAAVLEQLVERGRADQRRKGETR